MAAVFLSGGRERLRQWIKISTMNVGYRPSVWLLFVWNVISFLFMAASAQAAENRMRNYNFT